MIKVSQPLKGKRMEDEYYQINAVSRLTGLSTHNIRVWEKRYEVVEPERTDTGRRLYTREHIHRLSLLKSLVDAGHSIGTIARLGTDQLEQRLSEAVQAREAAPTAGAGASTTGARIAVVGSLIRGLVQEMRVREPALQIVAEYADLALASAAVTPGAADLYLIECPTLFENTVNTVKRLLEESGARRAILVYGFAPRATVDFVVTDIPGITAIRAPVNAEELTLACLPDLRLGRKGTSDRRRTEPVPEEPEIEQEPVPVRRFTNEQLVDISRATPILQCECPQHLVNLVFSLTAFESYSEECANRNPEDARMHSWLQLKTARARVQIEEALEGLMKAEGVEI